LIVVVSFEQENFVAAHCKRCPECNELLNRIVLHTAQALGPPKSDIDES